LERGPEFDKEILPAFTADDVKALLGACGSLRDRALVLVLLDTGLRAVELCSLKISDVTITTGAWTVRQGKGRKDRPVSLGANGRLAFRKYLMTRKDCGKSDPFFPSLRTGEPLMPTGLLIWRRKLGRTASVSDCHPHTFRRTSALWSLRAGMSIYALEQIMGHSDLSLLRQYLALVEQGLADAHQKHGAVDNLL
jgi:integrase/recombinase XerD